MFGTLRLVIILIIVAVVLGSLWYVTSMREQLAISQENNKKLNEAVVLQNELIEQVKKDVGLIQEANKELSSTIQAQNKDLNSLQTRFNTNADGSSRDIGQLAIAKPASIERAINRGTNNAIRCLEIASGAKLTEQENNAKTPSEINKECPSLANPNYVPAK
jgi:hypothetical protein